MVTLSSSSSSFGRLDLVVLFMYLYFHACNFSSLLVVLGIKAACVRKECPFLCEKLTVCWECFTLRRSSAEQQLESIS